MTKEEINMRLKKIFRLISLVIAIIIGILLILLFINYIPTFSLKTQGMDVFKGKWVNVYYEQEKDAAKDTFTISDDRAGELATLLGITGKQNINIYIYDNQFTMQQKKYGFIAPVLGLDWYIGDNIGTNIILTSPANPGKVHDYDNVKNAVLHEIIHAYNYVLNKNLSYWIDNGLAGYLSDQKPEYPICSYSPIPTFEQTQVKGLLSPITFADFSGYEYSYTYIEFLVGSYSWDKVKRFVESGDYEIEFGCTERNVYENWVHFVKNNYTHFSK